MNIQISIFDLIPSIELPAVGSTVYSVSCGKTKKCKIVKYSIYDEKTTLLHAIEKDGSTFYQSTRAFGKGLFTNRKEANNYIKKYWHGCR